MSLYMSMQHKYTSDLVSKNELLCFSSICSICYIMCAREYSALNNFLCFNAINGLLIFTT